MDEATKREILEPIMAAIASSDARSKARHEETHAVVSKVASDHAGLQVALGKLTTRVEVLEARGGGWDGRISGAEKDARDGIASAKKLASEVAANVESALGAVAARHDGLAHGIEAIGASLVRIETEHEEIKKDIGAKVLEALGAHVSAIETAADRLTRSPQVKTAAAVGGAFAGSAAVAAAIEIAKHFF